MNKYEKISEEIINNPKEINKLNIIYEKLITEIENNNLNNIIKLNDIIKKIYDNFLNNKDIFISKELNTYLFNKIETIFKIIFEYIKTTNSEIFNYEIFFEIFLNFIEFINNEQNRNNFFNNLIEIIIFNKEFISLDIILIFKKKFKKYKKNIFSSILNNNNKILEKTNNINILYNTYNYLISIKKLNEENDEKLLYQNILIKLMNNKTFVNEKNLFKNFIINLNKIFINNVNNPLIFSDFLINLTEISEELNNLEEFDIKIFSLSSLFILLTKYKLDYDKYYELIYSFISTKIKNNFYLSIFDSKYKFRFIKILQLSLKSSQVPLIIICSFIKKLSRILLFSNDQTIIIILHLILFIIKNHPKCLNMLMYKKYNNKNILKEEEKNFDWEKFNKNSHKLNNINNQIKENEINISEDNYTDIFDENELNPYKTKAQFCSLWELYTLKNHYNMKIRKLVNVFSNNFLNKEIAIEDQKEENIFFNIEKTNAHFYISE